MCFKFKCWTSIENKYIYDDCQLKEICLVLGLYEASTEEAFEDEGGLAALPDGRVTCLVCGKTLSQLANAKRHYKSAHQPNQPARCRVCKKLCKNKQARDMHLRRAHDLTPKLMRNIIPPPLPDPKSQIIE